MIIATAMNLQAIEAQMSVGEAAMNRLDSAFPVESASKPNGMFSSDCCGSNNYDQQLVEHSQA